MDAKDRIVGIIKESDLYIPSMDKELVGNVAEAILAELPGMCVVDEEQLRLCPDKCMYLSEPEDHPFTKIHTCHLFHKRVKHLGSHPRLQRCSTCLYLINSISEQSQDVIKVREGI